MDGIRGCGFAQEQYFTNFLEFVDGNAEVQGTEGAYSKSCIKSWQLRTRAGAHVP